MDRERCARCFELEYVVFDSVRVGDVGFTNVDKFGVQGVFVDVVAYGWWEVDEG